MDDTLQRENITIAWQLKNLTDFCAIEFMWARFLPELKIIYITMQACNINYTPKNNSPNNLLYVIIIITIYLIFFFF